MTPEQLELVGRSAERIEASAERFSDSFYTRLFEIDPMARSLFPDDMSAQRSKLTDEVVFLAEVASDLEGFVARAKELGARHRGYGVRVHDYASVKVALIHALAAALGEAWSDQTEAAWTKLYDLVAETMLEGATGELFSRT